MPARVKKRAARVASTGLVAEISSTWAHGVAPLISAMSSMSSTPGLTPKAAE